MLDYIAGLAAYCACGADGVMPQCSYQKHPEGERGKPVPTVHTDYTVQAGHDRIEVVMSKDEADALRQNPFAILQVTLVTIGALQSVRIAAFV